MKYEEIFEKLASNEDWEVRQKVAQSQSTPPHILAKLLEDENEDVRWGVAKNPNTPTDTLAELANDEDEDIRQTAVDKIFNILEINKK